MFIMDEKWWIKSIHYRWSMDDDNDLNHFRSDDLDIHRCISLCGWNVIILKWISSMDNKLDDIWTSKNCMNYHVKYTIFVMKNYESFIDVLDYVRVDRCHLWSLKLLIIASSLSSKELRLYSNRLLPILLRWGRKLGAAYWDFSLTWSKLYIYKSQAKDGAISRLSVVSNFCLN